MYDGSHVETLEFRAKSYLQQSGLLDDPDSLLKLDIPGIVRTVVPERHDLPALKEQKSKFGIPGPSRVIVSPTALVGSAVEKVRLNGLQAQLTPEEAGTVNLVFSKPSYLFEGGRLRVPTEAKVWSSAWGSLGDPVRSKIEENARRVGRIELSDRPDDPMRGTAFLVAPTVLMTNRHICSEIARKKAPGSWSFNPDTSKLRIDYAAEINQTHPAEFAITGVIGVHEKVDLALLRVERTGTVEPPEPLRIRAKPMAYASERPSYVVGHPARDRRLANAPSGTKKAFLRPLVEAIFRDGYYVKRLSPGEVTGVSQASLLHNCTTLQGSSGSCLFDAETHEVVGLHYDGDWLDTNWAVPLWTLASDPLLRRAGVQFE